MTTEPVEIKFQINNDELAQQSEKAVNAILGIGKSSDISIEDLQSKIQTLKSQYRELGAVIGDASKWGAPPKALTDEYQKIAKEISEAEQRINSYKNTTNTAGQTQESFRTAIRNVREEMSWLRKTAEDNGQTISETTGRYAELKAELGRLTDIQRDVSQQASTLANDEATLQGIISGISGVAGGFSAATGAVSLFAGENENLQKIMVKVQSLMAITIGLQQVQQTLNKDSAFRLKTVVQVTDMWNKSLKFLNVQLGISNALSKALMISGIGLLIVGAGYLISKFQDWRKEQAEITRLNNIMSDSFKSAAEKGKESANQELTHLKLLYDATQDNSNAMEERTKAVEELRKQYPDYFGKLSQEAILTGNAKKQYDLLTQSILRAAKARAMEEVMVENNKKIIGLQNQSFEDLWKEGTSGVERAWYGTVGSLFGSGDDRFKELVSKRNKEIETLQKTNEKLAEQIDVSDLIDKDKEKNKDKSGGSGDSASRRAEKEAQRQLDAERKLNETLRGMALEKRQFDIDMRGKDIDLMEDGFAKRAAQLKLNYDKELQSAREFAENKLKQQQEIERQRFVQSHGNDFGFSPATTTIAGLPEEVRSQIKQIYDSAQAEFNRGNELLGRELEDFTTEQRMRLASSLEQQLNDIEKYYRERIRQATGNEELIARLVADKGKEILNANTRYQMDQLDFEKDITLKRMELSNRRYLFEADKEKDILTVTKSYAEKRLELLKKLQSEGIQDLKNEIEQLEADIEGMNKQLGEIPVKKIEEALAGIKSITDALGGLDGTVGEVFSSLGSGVDSIIASFERAKSETKDYYGAISSAVSGVVDIINMVSSANSKRKQAEKEYYQNSIALAHEYALALNETLRAQSQGAGFVTDYAGQINDAFSSMSDATNRYYEALDKLSSGKAKTDLKDAIDWGSVGKGIGSGAAAGAAIGSIVPVIGTAVGAVVGGLIGGIAGLFGGKKKKEVFGGLLEVFPELTDSAGNLNRELAQTLISTNQLDDDTKQLVQNALDWADAVEAANEQVRGIVQDLAGDLGGSIRSALVDAWQAGEDASKRMFEAASESLGKFVEDLLYSAVFSDVFKQFQDELVASLNPITGDQDVVDDYDRLMNALDERDDFYIAALDAISQRAAERGLDFKNIGTETGNKQSAETGGFKTVSQESFDLWLGQFTAIRIHTSNIYDAMIHENEIMNNTFSRIEENTRAAADCLREIQGFARKWNDEGIRVA